jgi:hypothetical protein
MGTSSFSFLLFFFFDGTTIILPGLGGYSENYINKHYALEILENNF